VHFAAPASRIICTIFTDVVPRTIESSMSTMRLPRMSALIGVVLQLHAEVTDFLARLDEGPADIVRADDAELERNADSWLKPIAAGTPLSGTGTTRSASTGLRATARRRSPCGLRRPTCRRRSNPAARNRRARRCRARAGAFSNGRKERSAAR
jgi:hypothetical protein